MATKILTQSIINSTKTTRPSTKGFARQWYVLDASKEPLGRLATKAANLLAGKNRADFAKDVDMGACVVIINTDQTVLTGLKKKFKVYFRHSGRPGSMKSRSYEEQAKLDSTLPVRLAVKRMLPKNKLQSVRMNRLVLVKQDQHNLTQKLTPAN